MKRQTIIAILAVVFAAMAMPQNAVAKEKKVKYLGHQYQGEVDKEKKPCGKGVINIGGLVIEGDFKSNTVSNAEVYKSNYVEVPNRKFNGSVSFDESNNIALKSNGTLKTVVYYGDYNEVYFDDYYYEQLETDFIVNNEDFEPDNIKVTKKYNPFKEDKMKKLDAPQDVPYDIEPKLQEIRVLVKKWNNNTKLNENVDVKTKRYVISKEDKDVPKILTNYKDNMGRIWNRDIEKSSWSVLYPNGSYFKEWVYAHSVHNEFKAICPDGKIYEFNSSGMSIGNGLILGNLVNGVDDFLHYLNSSVISISARKSSNISISSEEYDFDNLSDIEVEKIIKEKFLPNVKIVGTIEDLDLIVYGRIKDVGRYKNGKYQSWATKNTAEAKAKDAEKKKQIAYWTKKFGFNPFSKKNSDIVKPGRSFALIKEFYEGWDFILSIDHGSSKCYDMYRNNRNFGYIWVANGIIKSVTWY